MSERRELTAIERAFSRTLQTINKGIDGFTAPFVDELVRLVGIQETMKSLMNIGVVAGALGKSYGNRDGQLLISLAAFWNGCDYCSFGHLYAANLYHFEQGEQLFPLSEEMIPFLQRLPDQFALNEIRKALSGVEYTRTVQLIERQFVLKMELPRGEPTADDENLEACNNAWNFLNQCTIISNFSEIPPLTNIYKKKDLIVKYLKAREKQRKAKPAY